MITFFPIAFPLVCALIAASLSKFMPKTAKFLGVAGTSLMLVSLFTLNGFINLKLLGSPYSLGTFEVTIAVFIAFFAALASLTAVKEEDNPWFYVSLLVSAAFAVGAVLADNFLVMLFFWEGLLITLYAFLQPYNPKTAKKAFLINAAGDVVLLAGICLFYSVAKTLTFAEASLIPVSCVGYWAFILIFTGTVAKAGAFPFHSWIADAVDAAPISFSALLPAAAEKLLAVFLLGKILTVVFPVLPVEARVYACLLGIITIAIAAIRMLNFKDLKNLLAWNIVMQIGLLIMGLALSNHGIVFILNHGLFKAALLACAFFTAGMLHYACGGNDLAALKSAGKNNPLATGILLVCALGLAGVTIVDIFMLPNALFADTYAAMPILIIVPALAALVTVFTFAKVFFALFAKGKKQVKENALMFKIAAVLSFIPVIFFTMGFEFSAEKLLHAHFAGFHLNWVSALCAVILIAGIILGAKLKYKTREIKFDTYEIIKTAISYLADALFKVDRVMDKLLDNIPSLAAKTTALSISKVHRGSTSQYIIWAVLGIIIFVALALTGGIR